MYSVCQVYDDLWSAVGKVHFPICKLNLQIFCRTSAYGHDLHYSPCELFHKKGFMGKRQYW